MWVGVALVHAFRWRLELIVSSDLTISSHGGLNLEERDTCEYQPRPGVDNGLEGNLSYSPIAVDKAI